MSRPHTEPGPLPLEELERLTADSTYADSVHRLLTVARTQLRMSIAWVSEFVGSDQVLRFVDAAPGVQAPAEGTSLPLGGSFCSRVLDGRFPRLIPNTRAFPEAALLEVTAELHIGAYVGVPLLGPSGTAVGMLCAIDGEAHPAMDERDVAALRLLAQVLHDLGRRAVTASAVEAERRALLRAVQDVVRGDDRYPVLQPIVDLRTGTAVAAEGLTRFTGPSPAQPEGGHRSAAHWFDDASRLGLREDLELVTAKAVLDLLDVVPAHVALAVNLGPQTLMTPRLDELLRDRRLPQIIVEITEHAPVADYDGLSAALRPYRERGLRLAVDDVGAGYSSLRHVLAIGPDLIKVDMALTRGADGDLVRRTLLTALAGFARDTGCLLVAEGVESHSELMAVADCGVDLVQGFALARPGTAPLWSGYRVLEHAGV
jgi:EAL domain-containing protein (putative c-di-GMP-specific phosphodiesterase class I)